MALKVYTAAEVLTAANLNESVNPKVAIKTSTETVNNSTTLQDDDQLFITPTTSATYLVQCFFVYQSAGTSAEVKLAFTFPAGASFTWVPLGITPTDANQDSANQAGMLRMGSTSSTTSRAVATQTGNEMVATPKGILIMGATAGNLQLQWAQLVGVVESTQMKANSCIVATRIS